MQSCCMMMIRFWLPLRVKIGKCLKRNIESPLACRGRFHGMVSLIECRKGRFL